MSKKTKVTTNAEKNVLSTSLNSIQSLSKKLGITEKTVRLWLEKNRPNYFVEVQNKEKHHKTQTAEEKAAQLLQEEHDKQVIAEAKEAKAKEEAILAQIKDNADNEAMKKLMSGVPERGVTIMTPAASERGDKFKETIKRNKAVPPWIHQMKKK